MKRFLLIILTVLTFPTLASHIVGGEFEILHFPTLDNAYRYKINLIYYFDEANGIQQNKTQDAIIYAKIFRFSDGAYIRTVALPFDSETPVSYTQPECSIGSVQTSRQFYTTTITMSPEEFGDPQGYYIVWERCCRNYQITNIQSGNPQDASSTAIPAGQTFYLKFPPVVKNGQPFINSSPHLFPPLSDYGCTGRLYYTDFAGTDEDGDSLVYSIVTPLSTHTADSYPPILSAPYPLVQWVAPFSATNILGGKPDLKISSDGFLTVNLQGTKGLFVFAVKCDEYRDGIKIGEVRRDFQMFVTDCPVAQPPKILGKKSTDVSFIYDGSMNVSFSNSVNDQDRCIQVQVSDPDSQEAEDNFQEKVSIRAIPINFKQNLKNILPTITKATLVNGSTQNFNICFDQCPYMVGPFQVGILAYDDACSLPLSDTLKITVTIEPPANQNAYFTTPNVDTVMKEGFQKTWPIQGIDDDHDPLIVGILTNGFNPADVGMNFSVQQQENGLYNAQLTWDTRCNVYDFTHRQSFELKVLLEDADLCNFAHPDTMVFKLNIKLPVNVNPIIDSDLTSDTQERTDSVTRKVFESLTFNVTGTDADNDFLVLGVNGLDFNINDYSVTFPVASGNGSVSSPFRWDISCDNLNLKVKDEFTFRFTVVDNANKCRFYNADTLNVVVKVLPPDNEKPELKVNSLNPLLVLSPSYAMTSHLGQQIVLGLNGSDVDTSPIKDLLKIELIKAEGNVPPTGYVFSPTEGRGTVNSTFTWNPDCSIFENGVYENTYTFSFRVTDDRCANVKGDTVEVNLTIKDQDRADSLFIPPNIVTPNGDNKNDFFAMVKFISDNEFEDILPKDNCLGRFVDIRIYNRWGKQVFESEKRDFRWYANGEAAGVYFYYLKFSDREYKGSISVKF